MRKLIFVIFLTCFSLNSFALVSTKVDGVKLRSGPGISYPQIMDLPKFYPLKVIAKSGQWYKVVDWMNTRGWVSVPLLSKNRTAMVKKIKVNLRSGPGTRYSRVDRLYKGYILRIIKRRGSWYQVIMLDPPSGKKGWIHRQLVWG